MKNKKVNLTDLEKRIIRIMGSKPMTAKQILEKLKKTDCLRRHCYYRNIFN